MPTNIVNVGYGPTNYYVVSPSPGAKLLVDCGWPGTMGRLNRELRRKGIDLEEVEYLLVTHYHPDHAGLTQELRNTGVQLLLMDTQISSVRLLKDYMGPDRGYVEIELEGSRVLKEEDSRAFLKHIGIKGEIIATPGHSPDSVSLILDEGIAFTGDLTHSLLLPDDDTTCRESWSKISAHGVTRILPAHGGSRGY